MYSFKNNSNLMLTNIFNKNNYNIQNKISESTIYIFTNLFNVWLNRKITGFSYLCPICCDVTSM